MNQLVPISSSPERFPVGGADVMADIAVRLNRQSGRNVDLPFEVFAGDGDEVLGVFGFAVELVREAGWLAKVPYAPSAALAAGDKVWAVYLLDRVEPAEAVLPVARRVRDFRGAL